MELAYKKYAKMYNEVLQYRIELLPLILRNLRAKLCIAYCKEVLREAYFESIKV